MFGTEDPENWQNTELSLVPEFHLKFCYSITLKQINIIFLAAVNNN